MPFVSRSPFSGALVVAAAACVAGLSCSAPKKGAESRYACPMHPEVQAGKPADCTVCGMKLVPVQEPAAAARATAPRYACPMHPEVQAGKPADCTVCGMKLVAAEAGPDAGKGAAASPAGLVPVRISGETRRQMGMTFGSVERKKVTREIRLPARIVADQARVSRVSAPTDGWADRLWANGVGERVQKGAPLIEVYAADWKDLALVAREANSEFARERLKKWGITEAQIEKMLAGGGSTRALRIYTLASPSDGFIAEKTVLPGQRFLAGEPLFVVADLSQVWAEVDLFESDIPWVRPGMTASITFAYWPSKEFRGKVALLSPFLDAQTRTLRARIEIPNPAFDLRPEMFGTARMKVDLGERLVVPEGSVMRTGERNYVFRAGEGDRVEPVEVKLGGRADGTWEVVDGLKEGERVVASANFLVDSESAIRSALSAVSGN